MALTYWPAIHRANRDNWKHGRRVGMLSDDPAALVNQLGGNAAVLGFYDVRRNVTPASGAAAQWDDARGAVGYGPSLVQATAGQRPAWDPAAQTLTFDGVNDSMGSALSSLFNLSTDKSVIVVGAGTAGNTGRLAILINATQDRFLGVQLANPAASYAPQYRDSLATNSAAITSVASGTTRRLIVAGKTNTSLIADIPNATRATAAPTGTCASENASLVLGDFKTSAAGTPCACVLRAVLVLNRQYTTADLAALKAWAVAVHGAVLA